MPKGYPSNEDVIDALLEAKGFVSVAAPSLGITPNALRRHIARSSGCRQAMVDIREQKNDFAEGKLLERIKLGEIAAITFYLKTQAKDRGYIEKPEPGQVYSTQFNFSSPPAERIKASEYDGDFTEAVFEILEELDRSGEVRQIEPPATNGVARAIPPPE